MPTAGSAETHVTVLRPMARRLSVSYGMSAALLTLPPLLALYVLTAGRGTWDYVLLLHLIILSVLGLLLGGLHRAQVQIEADGVIETGLFGRSVFTPLAEIASVLVLSVTDGNSSEVHDQAFVLDADGKTRLRLRGQFWGPDAMQAVVAAFDVPYLRIDQPKVMADVRADYGPQLYWHERHPVLRALLFLVGVFTVTGPVLYFLQEQLR